MMFGLADEQKIFRGIRTDQTKGKVEDPIDQCYEDLANAILVQACKDYKSKYARYLKKPDEINEDDLIFAKQFFSSEWFEVLCDLDGEELVKKIERNVRREVLEK